MTFSYSGDPSTSKKDQVRFILQDTTADGHILEDEEINFMIDDSTNVLMQHQKVLNEWHHIMPEKLILKIGDYSEDASDYFKHYQQLADDLDKQSESENVALVVPYAGGISISDKEKNESNEDNVKPFFEKHQFDNKNV